MLSATYSPEQYDITSGVTEFAITWGFFALTDIKVTVTDPFGVDEVLEYGTGTDKFTVSAINDDYSSGATLTTGTEYPPNSKITIERIVPYGQALDINGDFIPGEPLEQALDKLAAQIQQVKDLINRSLVVSATNADSPALTLNGSLASRIVGFDSNGDIKLYTDGELATFVGL